MVSRFRYELEAFLSGNLVDYYVSDNCIVIPNHKVVLRLLELPCETVNSCDRSEFISIKSSELAHSIVHKPEPTSDLKSKYTLKNGFKQFIMHEDLWFTKGEILRNRLLANIGLGAKLFARKCRVEKINAEAAKRFLEANHLLGDARSVFRYGLFCGEELVAVATFSASRPMEREDRVVSSYEWVRYVNKASLRIVGGMGKLLNYFVAEEKPEEIMSYADIDWSDGDAYRKLGFKYVGETQPVEFYVNIETYERVSAKKLLRDRKYRTQEASQQDKTYVLILNSGNLKFLRRFSLL